MKEKLSLPGELKVRQDPWSESPCSRCSRSPCCSNLPLAPLRLESRSDFINLTLASCYDGIYPALKKSGEWTIYLGRRCRFLGEAEGKCTIHDRPFQSMICKSYDSHSCWYVEAFSAERYTTMIPFDTEMMLWFEKRCGLFQSPAEAAWDWEELCRDAYARRRYIPESDRTEGAPREPYRLPFRKSRSDRYLFFPPYERPATRNHFELIAFRLGFPGVHLAISETCWSFLVTTELIESRLELFRRELFPAISHRDGMFSSDGMGKNRRPFSEAGDQWIVLDLADLEMLKSLTAFDPEGKVRRLPTGAEILEALKRRSPDRAA